MGSENTISIIIFVLGMLLFFGIAALIPYLLNAIGLARVCNKLDACSPVLAFLPILNYLALAKASDAADRHNGAKRKGKITRWMIPATLLCILSVLLLCASSVVAALFMNTETDIAGQILQTLVLWLFLALMFITYGIFLLRTVICCFCYWRICCAFRPAVLKFIVLGVCLLYANLSCVAIFILPFFHLREPAEKAEEGIQYA